MKERVQSFGRALSAMVMPNIGAFIAWGFITALFIDTGWLPNAQLSTMVSPFLTYVLPLLIANQAGRNVHGQRGAVIASIATVGVICGSEYTMLMGAMAMGPFAAWVIKKFDKAIEGKIKPGFEMLINEKALLIQPLQTAAPWISEPWISLSLPVMPEWAPPRWARPFSRESLRAQASATSA